MEKVAGTGAGTAIAAGSYAWLSQATEVATFGAAVVSIVVGIAAAWFYYEKARSLRSDRKDSDGTQVGREE